MYWPPYLLVITVILYLPGFPFQKYGHNTIKGMFWGYADSYTVVTGFSNIVKGSLCVEHGHYHKTINIRLWLAVMFTFLAIEHIDI